MKSFLWLRIKYTIKHPIKARRVRKIAKRMIVENKEVLNRLGSDYDENGVPYWEKLDWKE